MARNNDDGSFLDRVRDSEEEDLIAEQETTPVRIKNEAFDCEPIRLGSDRNRLNRTIDEGSDAEDKKDVGRELMKFFQRQCGGKFDDFYPTSITFMHIIFFIIDFVNTHKDQEDPLETPSFLSESKDYELKSVRELEDMMGKPRKLSGGQKRGRQKGRKSSSSASSISAVTSTPANPEEPAKLPPKGSRKGSSGRGRGRPRGSKSGKYTMRTAKRRRTILKPMYGGSASATELPDTDGNVGEGDPTKLVPAACAAGDSVRSLKGPKSGVTIVKPLFTRHYIVRRPFALPELNEKKIEFVMHETYFSRLNPYAPKRQSGEQLLPAGHDDLYLQPAFNNILMRSMPMDNPFASIEDCQIEFGSVNKTQKSSEAVATVVEEKKGDSTSSFFSKG